MAAFLDLYPLRSERQFFQRFDIYQYSDEDFLNKFRLNKDGFQRLSDLIRSDCERPTRRNSALSVEEITALSLRYFASGSFHSVIGETMGVSQPTAHSAIHDFSIAIDSHFHEFVKFPTDTDSIQRVKREFHSIGNFPHVIACVDGTHIPIEKPNAHEQRFVNRKHYHSINVQCMCDANGKLINVEAEWPGSCHDSYILRSSKIWDYMESNPNLGIILGDSAYPLRPWLMTPIRICSSNREIAYNYSHCKTRVTIENVFGRWKRRFPLLKFPSRRKKIPTILRDIRVAAILHNFAIDNNIAEPVMPFSEIENGQIDTMETSDGDQSSSAGASKRNFIVQSYF